MSAKIEQLLDLIEEILENSAIALENPSKRLLSDARISATDEIANRWDVDRTTISDKFIRGLSPDINSTEEFDSLMENWLCNDDQSLKGILLKHAIHASDSNRIEKVFLKTTETDKLLAQEFGVQPNEKAFMEGKAKFRQHLLKERNSTLVKNAKKIWIEKANGDLRCTICNFSFRENYGEYGKNYIEAHHKKPIELLDGNELVSVSDLAPVCSNCHRMLHHSRPWLSLERLIEIRKKAIS